MRHGEAGEAAHDTDRPLTPRGRGQALASAQGLLKLGVRIPQIWHSPYRRASETAAIVAAVHGATLVEDPHFTPEASPVRAANRVKAAPSHTLVVAHMPILPGLVDFLCHTRVGFSTAMVAHLVVGADDHAVVADLFSSEFLEQV